MEAKGSGLVGERAWHTSTLRAVAFSMVFGGPDTVDTALAAPAGVTEFHRFMSSKRRYDAWLVDPSIERAAVLRQRIHPLRIDQRRE